MIDLTSVLGQPATPETAPAAPDGGLPEAVLEIPAIAALLQGTPPAIWTTRDDPSPEVQTVVQNADALQEAGFGLYGATDGVTTVLFNSQFIDAEAIQAADKKGRLKELATPFSELKASLGSATAPEAAPAAGAAPQMASASPGAGFDKKLATKRMANLAVGSPTSGQAPGQGRILNSILQPTV